MDYYEVSISVKPDTEENREILTAILAQLPFESFADADNCIKAYIQHDLYSANDLNGVLASCYEMFTAQTLEAKLIKDENWNAEWEKNFTPIEIGDKFRIRAPFHEAISSFEYEIIIEPKMSFGTGHHATTSSIIELMLDMDFTNKSVLDMGCGTGVLAILAAMKNAKPITAIDIDEWAYTNSIENVQRNNQPDIEILQGDAQLLKGKQYDIIIANINRNILLNDMYTYVDCMSKGCQILFSGFYTEDLPMITEKANELGLTYQKHNVKKNWVAASFIL